MADAVRYAVVGAGWISQIAFMPGVPNTGNSKMTAIVSGNGPGAAKLAAFYGIDHVVGYGEYDALLASGKIDAVYIALPNTQHADFAIRAAHAGVHALVEKPLAVSEAECEAMIAAARATGTRLMTAYRLHNEPCTVAVLEAIRRGDIGTPRMFSSVFGMQAGPNNHRLQAAHWGGPLQDIGVYCLNAARHVFAAEPTEAVAVTARGEDPRFREVEETIAVTLRFPGGALGVFTASFGAHDVDTYRVVGTEGEITVDPAFRFDGALRMRIENASGVTERLFPQVDQFAGQTAYFSDCILSGEPPEADGAEGLADVRALRAIERAATTGSAQPIHTPPRPAHPMPDMVRMIPTTDRRLML